MGRPVKDLTPAHREVPRLASLGLTHQQIADETGFTRDHVRAILRNPEAKELKKTYSIMQSSTTKEAEVILRRAEAKAAGVLEQLLTVEEMFGQTISPRVRLDAAKEILKLCGVQTTVETSSGALNEDHMMERILEKAKGYVDIHPEPSVEVDDDEDGEEE